ncbi:MAG: prolyl oligopeptidase family serine peptidase, partial [Planctomycetota bacterium]
LSVDVMTSRERGWLPAEQMDMQRDVEAVTLAIEEARKRAPLDPSATVITGHSGGTYLTLWMGLRRPDLFMAVCGRACVFFKETAQFGKAEKLPPNLDMPIFLYHGELDSTRAAQETLLAAKTLKEAGFRSVTHRLVPKMAHASMPEVFMEWYLKLLAETEKPRKAAQAIAREVAKLREELQAGPKAGAYAQLAKLVEREKKASVAAGAAALEAEVIGRAKEAIARAKGLEAESRFVEAAAAWRKIEDAYRPLEVAKEAQKERARIVKSDEHKAEEMLAEGRALKEKGQAEKAFAIFEKVAAQYPETAAADSALLELGR